MRCITLTEPWASLVACGAKRIETRSWATDYRGLLGIHAAKGMTGNDLDVAIYTTAAILALPESRAWRRQRPLVKDAFAETRGRILAFAELLDCVPTRSLRVSNDQERSIGNGRWPVHPYELHLGDYTAGRWAWVLGRVWRLANPVPATGTLGLWEWETYEPPLAELVTFDWADQAPLREGE